jgi:phage/plasmid-like protein (TIGR03299 family)
MLDLAFLSNWDVRLFPLIANVDNVAVEVDDKFVVLRDNPFTDEVEALSVVGGRYTVVQNEALFDFGDTLLDGGGRWETAGSIRKGRQVFGSLLLPKEIVLDPNGAADTVRNYLLVNTSHDGTVGVQASVTPVRVVCQNTLAFALGGVKQTFKMRHTQTIEGRVMAAREALSLSFAYVDAFEREAQALIQTEMKNADFVKVATSLYPEPEGDSKAAMTRWENRIDLLGDIFTGTVDIDNAPNTSENIRNTAWAGLNAFTEYLDWYRTARGGDGTSLAEAASGFVPTIQVEKNRIRSAVLAFAGQ